MKIGLPEIFDFRFFFWNSDALCGSLLSHFLKHFQKKKVTNRKLVLARWSWTYVSDNQQLKLTLHEDSAVAGNEDYILTCPSFPSYSPISLLVTVVGPGEDWMQAYQAAWWELNCLGRLSSLKY